VLRSPAMFLPIALVGFGGIAVAAAGAAKFLFFLFMVRGLIFFVLRTWQGEESHNSEGAGYSSKAITSSSNPNMIAHHSLEFAQSLRQDPAKTATTEPNRILSPSFNSASVIETPLICVPFVECKSFSR
jgi:uncharacterized membrane protein YtjA (UPF0391 family)